MTLIYAHLSPICVTETRSTVIHTSPCFTTDHTRREKRKLRKSHSSQSINALINFRNHTSSCCKSRWGCIQVNMFMAHGADPDANAYNGAI